MLSRFHSRGSRPRSYTPSRAQPSKTLRRRQYSTEPSADATYDLCILGCGPAGFSAAMRAKDFHKNVCIIEKGRLGGAGLHDGALASKTLWEISNDYKRVASAKHRGFKTSQVEFSFEEAVLAVEEAQRIKESQLQSSLDKLGVPLFRGRGKFVSPHEIVVESPGSPPRSIKAKNFLIATGSTPRKHRTIPADGVNILTSDHIHKLKSLPHSMVILGAGVVGCEYATIFSNLGQTKVHVIDKAHRILPSEDDDVSNTISARMEEKGVIVHRGANLVSMETTPDGKVEYVVDYPAENRKEKIKVEKALLSIGREANLEGIGLDKAQLKLDKFGSLVTTDTQTSQPHIWAAGDSTIDIALVNIAELEGRHAVNRMFGPAPRPMTYENISTIMFLDPTVAACGLNEKNLQKAKISYKVAVYHYGLVSRSIAKGLTRGFIKLLVTNDGSNKILGIRALGTHASSIVDIGSLMIRLNRPVNDLVDLMVAYPAMTEGLLECARMLVGQSVHKPLVFPQQTRVAAVTYDKDGRPVIEVAESL